MRWLFADDSKQAAPGREGMSSLVAVGGVALTDSKLKPLTAEVDLLCQEAGFPDRDEFKWSPGRELWMRQNLTGQARQDFFAGVLSTLKDHDATALPLRGRPYSTDPDSR